ncbi:ionotropic receptor 21a-like [Panulirus ornatus]|uniref:ionotropic receptor 21a-like n=1 Tax=Panulirus ornatus TaxID=150431 RepID=UPI003A88E95B
MKKADLGNKQNKIQGCDGGEAVGAVLEAASEPSSSCSSVIIITDDTSPYTLLMITQQLQSVRAIFEVVLEGQEVNVTQAQISQVLTQARGLCQASRCVTVVVVVSDDPAFLATFAQFSLKGRLLGSSTRLLVVTRLPLIQLEDLLSSYWTFSMMNAMFLNMNDATACSRQYSGNYVEEVISTCRNFSTSAEGLVKSTLHVHSARTLCTYTLHVRSARTLFTYIRSALAHTWHVRTLSTYNLHVSTLCKWTVYVHMPYSRLGAQMVRVASWETGAGLRLHTQLKLFPNKFLNFYGATVNVTALPYAPHWMESVEQAADGTHRKRYSGTDFLLLTTVADTLNFTYNVLHSESWDAVVKRVEERVSFMAAQYFSVLPQRLEQYDFSFIYEVSTLDLCAAKPGLKPRWQSLYYPLADGVWFSIISVLLFVPVSLHMVNFVATRYGVGEKMDAETAFQMVVATFLNQNLTEKLPKTNTSRVLVTAWLVFAFIIGAAYQGNLTAALTLPKYPPRPETVEDFVNTFHR